MTPLMFFVTMISFIIALSYIAKKAIDWWFDFKATRNSNRIKLWSKWKSKDEDPWAEVSRVTVVDKRGLWIKYQYESGRQYTSKALWWFDNWEQV